MKKACVIDRSGLKSKVAVPAYRVKLGRWSGGDKNTLYAFTDTATGKTVVRPGGGSKASSLMKGIGPEASVRVATKEEAEASWQAPLHDGWKVSCD
jgi:hypothetical protein